MLALILGFLGGLFGGTGWGLLWETVLKPRRERAGILAALRAEIAHNVPVIDMGITVMANPSLYPPWDFAVATTVYTSIADRLDALKPDEITATVSLYADLDLLRRLADQHTVALREALKPDARDAIGAERKRISTTFYDTLHKIRKAVNALPPSLRPPTTGKPDAVCSSPSSPIAGT